jgi:hypothetical protein
MDPQLAGAGTVRIALIELLDRDDRVHTIVPVHAWPITIGRAIDNDVVLDDAHVAARHATIGESDGALALTVGETINGVRVRRQQYAASQQFALQPGDVFEVGGTRLRVRRATDPVAAEQPLVREAAHLRATVAVLIGATFAWGLGRLWLNTDPGSRITDYLPVLLGALLAQGVWVLFWSVGSMLIRRRFDFWRHARIAFGFSLAGGVAMAVLPLLAFSLGWTFLSRVSMIVFFAISWAMVAAHLRRIFPSRPAMLAGVMATLFIAGGSLFLFRNYQLQDRVFPELYVTTLGPPALRVAPTVGSRQFLDEARRLKAVLDAHAKDDDGTSDAPIE